MEMVSPGRADGGDRSGGHPGIPVRVTTKEEEDREIVEWLKGMGVDASKPLPVHQRSPRRLALEADRLTKLSDLLPVATLRSRSKYSPRLNVPKAQRKALKEMVEKYGRPAQ